ncbi:MAG: hypothetical protein D9N11_00985 [Ketobacter sp.]|nr:MAG: hypothetical protein D9N11_00985 [Ketobacter sp.]
MKEIHKRRKLRNPFANDPLLRKGGVHEKSRKARRAADKRELRNKVMNRDDSSPCSFVVSLSVIGAHL